MIKNIKHTSSHFCDDFIYIFHILTYNLIYYRISKYKNYLFKMIICLNSNAQCNKKPASSPENQV